jgi:uncharacterized RDD family membrane protein YckC
MKCPKCGYLGFEQVDRCRNCGYDFSLAKSTSPLPELPLNEGRAEEVHALDDFSFLTESPSTPDSASRSPDLPLFEAPVDDTPLITKASPPRSPLAVRRATPEVPRLRAEPRAQAFDLGFEPEVSPLTRSATAPPIDGSPATWSSRRYMDLRQPRREPTAPVERDAGLVARFLAVAADVIVLGSVDVLVVYFTMQICGLSLLELSILPKAPMLAFLIVQNGGYFVAFTASGQTLGKMAAGIRVVTADEAEPLSVGRAGLRTLMWALLALPAGLGFLTALFRSDHRGLHDRFAGTRVVRASA